MPNFIFKDTKVVSMEDDKPARLTFSPASLPGIPTLNEQFWVTDIRGGVEPNYQILYAFSNNIYVNAFTPRLSVFELQGVYVPSRVLCGVADNADQSSQTQPAFMQMYWEYNIVDANADPENQKLLTVSFNQIVIRGFLVKADIGRYNQDGIDGHMFKLSLLGFVETGKVSSADIADRQLLRTDPAGFTPVSGGGIDAGGLAAGAAVAAALDTGVGSNFLGAARQNLERSRARNPVTNTLGRTPTGPPSQFVGG
jgi:hypothetical protein